MSNHLQNGRVATGKSRALSLVLAFLMLVSTVISVPSGVWADPAPDPMYTAIENVLTTVPCAAHGRIDFTFGSNDSLTRANFNGLLTGIFNLGEGYTVSVNAADFADLKNQFGGLADGAVLEGIVNVTFRNDTTEESAVREIAVAIRKDVNAFGAGVIPNGAFSVCPDDRAAEMAAADAALDGVTEVTLPGGEYTADVIEAYFRNLTGLADSTAYKFYVEGIENGKAFAGDDVFVAFEKTGDPIDTVGAAVVLKLDLMYKQVSETIEGNPCNPYNRIDIMYGTASKFTEAALNAYLTGYFGLGDGYTVAVDSAKFATVKDAYTATDNGGFVIDDIDVTFTNNTSGEAYVETINFCFRNEWVAYIAGAFDGEEASFCDADRHPEMEAAQTALAGITADTVMTLPDEDYSEAAIEAYFRDLTGLTGSEYEFFLVWLDTNLEYEGNDVCVAFRLVDGDRIDAVGAEAILKIEPLGMIAEIDERYSDLLCVAHGDLNLQFGTGGSLTEDSFNAVLTEIFGYPAVAGEGYQDLKNAMGGAGDYDHMGYDGVTVTFTNPENGAVYVKSLDITIRKDLWGKWGGAVEAGALSVCPDEWPDDFVAARAAISAYNDEYVVTMVADEYSEASVEAFLRDVTGLGDDWELILNEFTAADAAAGDYISFCFVNRDVNGEGRTLTVGNEVIVKYVPGAMIDAIDEKASDLLCVAHGKLDLVFGTSGTVDNIGTTLTEIFGYPATVSASEIQRIKDSYGGLGSGQSAWVDNVQIVFTDTATGATYTKAIDLALYKNVYAKYSGVIDDHGFLGACPDEWPDEASAAMNKVVGWDDETKILMPGTEFTLEAIEAWFREETGLGDGWTFTSNWYDASKATAATRSLSPSRTTT